MNDVTFIITYYGQVEKLLHHCKFFSSVDSKLKHHFKVMFINDGFDDSRLFEDMLDSYKDRFRLSAYKVTQDVGFNSHGCRNLGMLQSDTHWNILTDIDVYWGNYLLEEILTKPLSDENYYVFKVLFNYQDNPEDYEHVDPKKILKFVAHPNVWLMSKPCFWSSGGYDIEFTGLRHGDGEFFLAIDKDKYDHVLFHPEYGEDYENFPHIHVQDPNRAGSYINQATERAGYLKQTVDFVSNRNEDKERRLKKRIICFPWTQVI